MMMMIMMMAITMTMMMIMMIENAKNDSFLFPEAVRDHAFPDGADNRQGNLADAHTIIGDNFLRILHTAKTLTPAAAHGAGPSAAQWLESLRAVGARGVGGRPPRPRLTLQVFLSM